MIDSLLKYKEIVTVNNSCKRAISIANGSEQVCLQPTFQINEAFACSSLYRFFYLKCKKYDRNCRQKNTSNAD